MMWTAFKNIFLYGHVDGPQPPPVPPRYTKEDLEMIEAFEAMNAEYERIAREDMIQRERILARTIRPILNHMVRKWLLDGTELRTSTLCIDRFNFHYEYRAFVEETVANVAHEICCEYNAAIQGDEEFKGIRLESTQDMKHKHEIYVTFTLHGILEDLL